jgi:hypothetical protein
MEEKKASSIYMHYRTSDADPHGLMERSTTIMTCVWGQDEDAAAYVRNVVKLGAYRKLYIIWQDRRFTSPVW